MYSVELKPMVGRQKSYYGKAHIIFMGDCIVLKSYETLVMAYNVKAKPSKNYGRAIRLLP